MPWMARFNDHWSRVPVTVIVRSFVVSVIISPVIVVSVLMLVMFMMFVLVMTTFFAMSLCVCADSGE